MSETENTSSNLDDIEEDDALAQAYNRGLALQKSGDLKGAEQAFRQVLALDPEDTGGASVRLAAIGADAAPEKMPDAYVATLFDQHEVYGAVLPGHFDVRVQMESAARQLG